ncbi:MAG: hypothetical protein EXX96DRAFT_567480 [Benjaminiella poitrasii]|nr:MAG: hypothetical protein EXX96DRAFT_567480 [Benjaminiella poitrasii]
MYSFDFAVQISRICMDEIRKRGLTERKILRKSVPNGILILKVFRKHNCTADDLTQVSIHSVATLMQDTIWCCQERIIPRKIWRIINYETCTLEELSRFISKRGKNFLLELLDFLVQVMQYKELNQMDAYRLGEAMGKITLGPTDCGPILAEKAGHFLARMIIEHSKKTTTSTASTARQMCKDDRLMSKSEATRAKAKSYNRLIKRIQRRNYDWLSVVQVALHAMLENAYETEGGPGSDEPYLSIFSTSLDPAQAYRSPVLYRLITEASFQLAPATRQDPFTDPSLFNTKQQAIESQIRVAFDDFVPLLQSNRGSHQELAVYMNEKTAVWSSKMKLLNSSLSHIKLNLKKHRSQASMSHNGSLSDEETLVTAAAASQFPSPPVSPPVSRYHERPLSVEDSCSNKTYYPDLLRDEGEDHSSVLNRSSSSSRQHQMKGSMIKMMVKMGSIVQ